MVEVSKIKPDPKQPRKYFSKESIEELAASIKEHGVIKNIEIDKNFFIVTGENRWRAAKKAGLGQIPCRIIDQSDESRFERQLHENIHHTPMSDWDLAMAIKKYVDNGETHKAIAHRFNKSEAWVQEKMEWFRLSPNLQKELRKINATSKEMLPTSRLSSMEKRGLVEAGAVDLLVSLLGKADGYSVKNVKIAVERIRSYPESYKEIFDMAFSNLSEVLFQAEIDIKFPQKTIRGGMSTVIFHNRVLANVKQATAAVISIASHESQLPDNLRSAILKLHQETEKSLKLLSKPSKEK